MTECEATREREADERSEIADEPDPDGSHLAEVPDGSGCTEIWEHLSERRRRDGRGETDPSDDETD